MSNATFNELLAQSLSSLNELLLEDAACVGRKYGLSKKKDYGYFLRHWGSLYVRYIHLSRQLEKVHDQMLQPQQRADVRMALDSCLGRMLEMKFRIQQHCGDYVSLDGALLDLKLSPDMLEVPIPSYFVEDRSDELEARRRHIASLITYYIANEPNAPVAQFHQRAKDPGEDPGQVLATSSEVAGSGSRASGDNNAAPMSVADAVALLQRCERGRQGRQRAEFQKAILRQERRESSMLPDYTTITGKDQAATIVQRVALGYLERKRAHERRVKELELLGMAPTAAILANTEQTVARQTYVERKLKQEMNAADLIQQTKEVEDAVRFYEAPRKLEEMLDEVLLHMAHLRLNNAYSMEDAALAALPPPEEGGAIAMLNQRATTDGWGGRGGSRGGRGALDAAGASLRMSTDAASRPLSGVAGASAGREGGSKAAPAKASGDAGRQVPGKGKGRGSGAASKDDTDFPALGASEFWSPLGTVQERYHALWKTRFDESYYGNRDLEQRASKELIRQSVLSGPTGVLADLHRCVDTLVTAEVNNLKERLAREKGGKGKRKKSTAAKRAKKPPKLVDPSQGVTQETCFNTAVHMNVVRLPDDALAMTAFVAAPCLMATPLDEQMRAQAPDATLRTCWKRILDKWDDYIEECMKMKKEQFEVLYEKFCNQSAWLAEPSLAQVKAAVTEYAILPLGSQVIHDLAPHHTAMLLYGFPGSGKSMLTHIICNEAGACLFDLSPSTFRPETGMGKAMEMVFRLARTQAPSVIFIDNVEVIFGKQGGRKKGVKDDPKAALRAWGRKMKKDLVKQMGSIDPTVDRVLVVGSTSAPWECDAAVLAARFPAMVYCPSPDYASRTLLWERFVEDQVSALGGGGAALHLTPLLPAEDVSTLATLSSHYSAGDIKRFVKETLGERRVRQLEEQPLAVEEFATAMSRCAPISHEAMEAMRVFIGTLPLVNRKIKLAVDLAEDGADGSPSGGGKGGSDRRGKAAKGAKKS